MNHLTQAWLAGESLHRHALIDRIMAKTVEDRGCWLYVGARKPSGYAAIGNGGSVRNGHRLVYELLVGPIPSGMELDHLCRVRECVNPAHLEPVTRNENGRRARKTHCKRGHEKSEANIYTSKRGIRHCRPCAALYQRARRRLK